MRSTPSRCTSGESRIVPHSDTIPSFFWPFYSFLLPSEMVYIDQKRPKKRLFASMFLVSGFCPPTTDADCTRSLVLRRVVGPISATAIYVTLLSRRFIILRRLSSEVSLRSCSRRKRALIFLRLSNFSEAPDIGRHLTHNPAIHFGTRFSLASLTRPNNTRGAQACARAHLG
jgi:hypothetical protein